uniref:Uncharacterized protein n=1 Tax=Panagrolaimus sp. PS1159 TaxID=55785 RepID=A0AC35FWZ6_9BILA
MAANEEKCLKSRSSIQCITINAKNYVRYFKECKLSLNKVTKRLTIRPSGNEEICVAFGRTFIRHNDFLCIDACEIDKNKYAIIFRDAEQCERFLVNANQKKGQFFAYIKISNDDDFIAEIFLSTIAKQFQHDPSLYPLKPIFLELAEYFKQKNGNCNSANVSTNDTVLNEGVPTSGDIFALSAATESNDAILSVDTVLSEVSFESKVQQQVSVSLNDTEILSDTVESNSSANTVTGINIVNFVGSISTTAGAFEAFICALIYRASRSSIQCITINAENYVHYFKECKLSVNKGTKQLIIRLSDNEEICAAFRRTFIRHNDFLCIDACENDTNKYAIIFRDVEQCERFLVNLNQKKGQFFAYVKISNDGYLIADLFFSPIFKQFSDDPSLYPLRPLLLELAEYYNQKNDQCNSASVSTNDTVLNEDIPTSDDIFALSSATESNDAVLSVDTVLDKASFGSKVQQQVYVSSNDTEILPDTVESVINSSANTVLHEAFNGHEELDASVDDLIDNLNVINDVGSNERKRSRSQPKKNYNFADSNMVFCTDDDESEISQPKRRRIERVSRASMNQSESTLQIPSSRDEEKYPTNFKFINYIRMGNSRSRLFIFPTSSNEFTDTVLIFGKKETRKFLLLFTSVDQKQFYKLQWDNGQNLYACMECTKSKKSYVQACVRQDKDGNEFVYVRNQKHACSNMKYLYAESDQPTEEELTTFKVPDRLWIKRYKAEKAAATFTKRRFRKKTKIQPRKPRTRSTRPKTHVSNQSSISKYIQKPNASNVVQSIIESFEQSIKKSTLSQTQSSDKSKTRQTNNESKIIKPSMYKFFTKAWRRKNLKKLAVFVSDDKKMCYEYTWHSTHKAYVCSACISSHNKHVFAKVIQNENGEECIQLGANDHKCNLKPFLP